jgi:hypothetical protein
MRAIFFVHYDDRRFANRNSLWISDKVRPSVRHVDLKRNAFSSCHDDIIASHEIIIQERALDCQVPANAAEPA